MIDALINGILHFFNTILGGLVAPIDALISQYLPSVSDALTSFGNFINGILQIIPWVLSYFKIPAFILYTLITWLVAKILINYGVHTFKMVLAWWRTLKL